MQNLSISLILMVIFTIMAYVRLTKLVYDSKSGVKPNIASWLPWLAVDTSICFASIAAGELTASILFGIFSVGTVIIISLILKNGEINLSGMDKLSLALSSMAFVAWKLMSDPEIAIYLNVFIAVMATIPTLRQTLLNPKLEDGWVWGLFALGGGFNLLTISEWTMAAGLPAVLVFMLQIALFYAASREEEWFRKFFKQW